MSHLEKCDNFYIVKNQIYMSIAKTSITKNVTLVTKNVTLVTKNVTDKCRFVTKNVTLVTKNVTLVTKNVTDRTKKTLVKY